MSTDIPGLTFVNAPAAPETFNVLLWAPAKQGKSAGAATAPGPIMWVNAEGGGALGFARKVAADRGTQILEVEVSVSDRNAGQILDQVYRHVHKGVEPRPRTVVVDTVGKLRDALVEQFVDKGSAKSLKQYGVVSDKLGGFIRAMRDLPVNLILLAHADFSEDAEDGRVVRPLIGGKLTETIPGEVDVVAYVSPLKTDDGIEYFAQLVDGKGRTGLGDRSGGLADERGIRRLDLSEWLEAYRAALTPAADADVPFVEKEADLDADPDAPGGQFDLDEARAEAA
jgi:hypothetical protein